MTDSPAPIDFAATLDEKTKTITLVAALIALFLAALDQTIVATALPRIAEELHGRDLYAWVFTSYILSSTAMVPVYGKLSDIFGRRSMLLWSIAIFLASSALCGASQSMLMLVVVRGLQGLGAAGITSIAFTVVADLYEPRKRARMQGMFGAVFGIANIIGPLAGGAMTEHLSWRSIFYVNLPIGAVAVIFIVAKMPALKSGITASIDYVGATLLVLGCVPLMLALGFDHTAHPWGSIEVLTLLASGVVLLALFVLAESRAKDPLLPLRLFRNGGFASSSLVSFLFGMAFFGALLFIPLFMVQVMGVSETAAGTSMIPLSVAMPIAATLGGRLASRTGRVKPFILGALVLTSLGYLWMATLHVGVTYFSVTMRMLVLGLGMGPLLALLTVAIQNAVDKRDLGVATSARQFFQQLGTAFGSAILGAVLTTQVAVGMKANLAPIVARAPAGMRAELVERLKSGADRSSGAHAMATARRSLPPALQASLDEAKKKSFSDATARLFVWSLGFSLVTLLAAFAMRDERLESESVTPAA